MQIYTRLASAKRSLCLLASTLANIMTSSCCQRFFQNNRNLEFSVGTIKWVEVLTSERFVNLKVRNLVAKKRLDSSLLQDSVISPTLFLIFIDDLLHKLQASYGSRNFCLCRRCGPFVSPQGNEEKQKGGGQSTGIRGGLE